MVAQVFTAYYSFLAFTSMVASFFLAGPLLKRFGAKRLAAYSADGPDSKKFLRRFFPKSGFFLIKR
jgi:hypothetical protein